MNQQIIPFESNLSRGRMPLTSLTVTIVPVERNLPDSRYGKGCRALDGFDIKEAVETSLQPLMNNPKMRGFRIVVSGPN